jgi:hypothetical protein
MALGGGTHLRNAGRQKTFSDRFIRAALVRSTGFFAAPTAIGGKPDQLMIDASAPLRTLGSCTPFAQNLCFGIGKRWPSGLEEPKLCGSRQSRAARTVASSEGLVAKAWRRPCGCPGGVNYPKTSCSIDCHIDASYHEAH